MSVQIYPQSATLGIEIATANLSTQGKKIFSVGNGAWQWRIEANYRNLTHDQWIILQENLLRTYGTYAVFKFYINYLYPNAVGFSGVDNPIQFNIAANATAGSHSIVLSNTYNYSTNNYFKTGDVLYHPNLGPGNMNIVAADVQLSGSTTVPLVRPIRADLTTTDTVKFAEYIWVSCANKDWTVKKTTGGYYNIDVQFIVRDKFRNYQ